MALEIKISNLTVKYVEKTVFDNFSQNIPLPGVTVLSGESGCGKTTLLRVIAGLQKADSGIISGVNPEKIAFLFQENRLFPWRTCLQHITDVLPKNRREEGERFLNICGLGAEKEAYPEALSGGMARRLALARTLALGGELYVLDEPFTGVDPERRAKIFGELKRLSVPVLLVSHDEDITAAADYDLMLQSDCLTKK